MPWGDLLATARSWLGWTPQVFWSATLHEFETALLVRWREVEPGALDETQTREMFERLKSAGAVVDA